MNKNWKDIGLRVLKTFLAAASGVLVVQTGLWIPALIVGGVTALISLLTNVLGWSPTSVPGRALMTFAQTFVATFAAAGYLLETSVLVAAVGAAITAVINFLAESLSS